MSPSNVGEWSSVLTLIVFFLTNIIVIFPFRIPVPRFLASFAYGLLAKCYIVPPSTEPHRRTYIHVNFLSAPFIAVLFLLAVQAIDGMVIRKGVLGADGVQPINIMALFISLAYISISLDATGLLRFLAFWVAQKGGSSGHRLYLYLYVFFLACGVIVGNDPVILSGTVFLAYLTRMSGITPPTAWIFAQFTAANMASVVLVSSNPTNLVLSGAFSLTFVTYTSSLILPFLAAAALTYPFLKFVLFRSIEFIPSSIELPMDDAGHSAGVNAPSAALVDKSGAIFGSALLISTLGVLVGTSTIGVPVWKVTVPPAVIMLARDIWMDWKRHNETMRETEEAVSQPKQIGDGTMNAIELHRIHPSAVISPALGSTTSPTLTSLLSLQPLKKIFPTVHTILQRLPIALLPFAFLMFILVQGLASKGWVGLFAEWWRVWTDKTGPVGATFGMAIVSGLLCNICGTNIGTTILLARTVQQWLSVAQPSAMLRYASIYSLALGSNYGAFTLAFSASLAGLLWRDILRHKGIYVRQAQFATLNAGTFTIAIVASSAVLITQSYVIHGKD